MGFYWKGDQLVARKGQLEDSHNPFKHLSPWSTFDMPLRDPSPIPKTFDFTQFLCSSLTFMKCLQTVEVWFDGHRLAQVSKSSGVPRKCTLPPGLRTKTSNGLMDVTEIESTSKLPLFCHRSWISYLLIYSRAQYSSRRHGGSLYGRF
jgi:hypothetical protein